MATPSPQDVRRALSALDPRQEKIVAGLFTIMIREPARVRELEWISEQLASVTLLAGEFEAASTTEGVARVEEYLRAHARDLLDASYLLFQQVGRDLEPRAAAGFTLEDALQCALGYLPSAAAAPASPAGGAGGSRDLGVQPLAALMAERELEPKHLVSASSEQLTHKMVSRAMKGRRLTANTMDKVVRAWNLAAGTTHGRGDLFDYAP